MDDVKKKRTERENINRDMGIKVDVDFQVLVERERLNVPETQPVSLIICLPDLTVARDSRPTQNMRMYQETTNICQGTRKW